MKKVQRSEIVDYITYNEQRDSTRPSIIQMKASRRIHLGKHLTFLFENTETIRYQIQEMTRAEQIVKEADIRHEIKTYNELLGDEGELGCTLLIEIDDPEERNIKLREWLELPKHLYLKLEDGTRSSASYDERQVGEDRVSSVQYLKFQTQGKTPLAIGCAHPRLSIEESLSEEQKSALIEDLNS